jgi:prevent-host-death family protein
MHYTLQEAKTQLSRLLTEAESGKEVIITRRNRPCVRLQPVHLKTNRVLGAWKGKYPPLGDAALEALPDREAEDFLEGR